jgi:hypothetical protein
MKDLLIILTILVFLAIGPFLIGTIGRFVASLKRTFKSDGPAIPVSSAALQRGKKG